MFPKEKLHISAPCTYKCNGFTAEPSAAQNSPACILEEMSFEVCCLHKSSSLERIGPQFKEMLLARRPGTYQYVFVADTT